MDQQTLEVAVEAFRSVFNKLSDAELVEIAKEPFINMEIAVERVAA